MKASSVLTGIGLLALSGIAVYFWRELEAGGRQVEILTSNAQELQPQAAASPVPSPAQSPQQLSNVAELPAQPVANPGRSELEAEFEGLMASIIKQTQSRMQSPEGQDQLRAQTRDWLESSFPDLEQVLGLTTAENDELLDLLAMQRVRGMTTPAPENESAQDNEARQRRRQETEASELQVLLGSKYLDWQDYQETQPVRQQVRSLRLRLDAAGIALTQMQERALVNSLSIEQRSINQTAQSNSLGLSARYTPEIRQRLLNAATSYLSVEQLDEYERELESRAAQEEKTTWLIEGSR